MTSSQNQTINYTVLVTRPRPLSTSLCQLVRNLGGKAIDCPVFELLPVPTTLSSNTLGSYSHVVFLSQAAAHASSDIIKQLCSLPLIPTVWSIGPATQAALLAMNIPLVRVPKEYSSEGLLDSLLETCDKSQSIAVFCGKHSRDFLLSELKQLGYVADTYEVYKRQALLDTDKKISKLTKVNNERIVVVCTSVSGLMLLVSSIKRLLPQQQQFFKTIPLVTVSTRILNIAKRCWFNQKIFVTQGAGNDAIVETLLSVPLT